MTLLRQKRPVTVRQNRSMIEGMTATGPKEGPRVVAPGALAVHADRDLGVFQYLNEVGGRELGELNRSSQHL